MNNTAHLKLIKTINLISKNLTYFKKCLNNLKLEKMTQIKLISKLGGFGFEAFSYEKKARRFMISFCILSQNNRLEF